MQKNLNEDLDQSDSRCATDAAWQLGSWQGTYGELVATAGQAAGTLTSAGVVIGDRAAVLLKNCPEIFQLLAGISRVSVVAVRLNSRSVARELGPVITDAKSRIVMCGGKFMGAIDVTRNITAYEESSDHLLVCRFPAASADEEGLAR